MPSATCYVCYDNAIVLVYEKYTNSVISFFPAALYGQGVYFAVRSSYSMHGQYSPPDSVGRRYIYQCKVLVGYALKGMDQMKFLPRRDDDITYDSATDDEDNPEMYIIFHDSQAYPEYLIVFQ